MGLLERIIIRSKKKKRVAEVQQFFLRSNIELQYKKVEGRRRVLHALSTVPSIHTTITISKSLLKTD